jgi:hypothetical protein
MAAPLIAVAKTTHKDSEMCIMIYEMTIDFLSAQEIEVEVYAATFLMIYFIVQSACSQCRDLICDFGSVRAQALAALPTYAYDHLLQIVKIVQRENSFGRLLSVGMPTRLSDFVSAVLEKGIESHGTVSAEWFFSVLFTDTYWLGPEGEVLHRECFIVQSKK